MTSSLVSPLKIFKNQNNGETTKKDKPQWYDNTCTKLKNALNRAEKNTVRINLTKMPFKFSFLLEKNSVVYAGNWKTDLKAK